MNFKFHPILCQIFLNYDKLPLVYWETLITLISILIMEILLARYGDKNNSTEYSSNVYIVCVKDIHVF